MKSGWRKLRQRIFRPSAYLRAASFPLPLGNGRTGIEMIKLTGVTKSFGALDVLKGIDLELHRGDSMVLIGGSGSGKSLLLKSMIGLVRPDSGTVEIDGQDVRRMRGRERRAFDDRFGMLFQYGGLFDGMPVWQNIAFKQLQAGQISERDAREMAADKLSIVNLGPEVGDLYPAELSGGCRNVSVWRARLRRIPKSCSWTNRRRASIRSCATSSTT